MRPEPLLYGRSGGTGRGYSAPSAPTLRRSRVAWFPSSRLPKTEEAEAASSRMLPPPCTSSRARVGAVDGIRLFLFSSRVKTVPRDRSVPSWTNQKAERIHLPSSSR